MAKGKHTKEDVSPKPQIEDLEQKYEGMAIEELGKAMYALEVDLERLARASSALQTEYDYLRLRAIPNKAEELDIKSVVIQFSPNYSARLGFTTDMYVGMIDNEKAMEWLRDNGHGGLIRPSVHAGSLKAAIKQRIATGQGEPPLELFKIEPFRRAGLTKV